MCSTKGFEMIPKVVERRKIIIDYPFQAEGFRFNPLVQSEFFHPY
jgi:hypothetical protein